MADARRIGLIGCLFLWSLISGCLMEEPLLDGSDQTGIDDLGMPSFEDYVEGKDDTGYVGNRAAELNAVFTSRVRVLVPDQTADQLGVIAQAILANPHTWEYRHITSQVTEQIKYARNALKSQHLNLNLEGGTPSYDSIDVIDGGLELVYTVRIESLVKVKDLESQNLTIDDLVGRTIRMELPLVPAGLFERIGAACATDPDTGGVVDPHELGTHNLFYYYDPRREGCPLTEQDLVAAEYRVESSLQAPTVFPEYDRLVADNLVTMVVIFGQITHGELSQSDWGFISFNDMTRSLTQRGFQQVESFADNQGHRLERRYPSGLTVSIDMYTPVGFADSVPREEASGRFRQAIHDHEIVYYNGHAFYGSLTVLDSREAYPQDTYQIIFMDACWSYAYYTKQIFRNRATEQDPEGYALVDVVNNTEPGITGSEQTATILWDNLFRGAAAVAAGSDASIYSWNNLVQYMNEHAEARARRRISHTNPEIYGASGVRTNHYQPSGVAYNPDLDPDPEHERYASTAEVSIPDNDSAGAFSIINVPGGSRTLEKLHLQLQIEHTYIGDLTVTLQHADRTLTLHDRSDGDTENLSLDLDTEHFSGLNGSGQWILRASDGAQSDIGKIVSWSIAY